jgi:nitroimidazol reductase NimA-like FMN-containing flavoprotein (pyridoxamine 5'-phosphate oxidase superfamily)
LSWLGLTLSRMTPQNVTRSTARVGDEGPGCAAQPAMFRKLTGFVPWANIDAVLRASRTIWLATTRGNRRPHAVPVWFVWDGEQLWFAAHERSQKARNLEQERWAVLHLGDGDDVVILEGLAEEVTEASELVLVDAARAQKYVDPQTGARDTVLTEGTLVYRLRPQKVMAWAYGNVATISLWKPTRVP